MNKAFATKDTKRNGVEIILRVQDRVLNLILNNRKGHLVDKVTS